MSVLTWAIRRREEQTAAHDASVLKANINMMIYINDPKQFSGFMEIAEPLYPQWLQEVVKKRIAEQRRRDADNRVRASFDAVQRALRQRG